ncbi:MAG: GlxA family transcriptional regulator [Rhodobacteraceae bacterium]|nr:GlxA family transcriptional regulator [Paracoccaceae bacterium]
MTRNLFCLLLPRFNMYSLMNIVEAPRIANYLSPAPLFAVHYISFDGTCLTASNSMSVECSFPPERLDRNDMLFVVGSWGAERYANKKLFSWIRVQARLGVKIYSVEQGAYLLARAGLLNNRKATTHWSYIAGFREQFPDIDIAEQLFTEAGQITCCSGAIAGIDLMLKVIRDQHGEALASEISNQVMHHPVRAGKDPQRKSIGRGLERLGSDVRAAIEIIEANISDPLCVPEIARQVGLSQRQLERQFNKSVGCSIVQFGLLLRLQHARVLLISTDLGVREIATASGFNSLSHFAQAFKKCFGRRPSGNRQAWPEQDSAPHWPGTLGGFLETLNSQQKAKLENQKTL